MTTPIVAGRQVRTGGWWWPRTRLVALCVVYSLLSLWAVVMCSFGVAMVVLGRLPDPSWTFAALAAGAFKVLTVGPALVVLASRGRSVLAVRALVVGQLTWFAVDVMAPEEPATPVEVTLRSAVALILWVGPWLLLSDHPSRLWKDPVRVRRPLLGLMLVVAAACSPWALANTRLDPAIQTSLGTSAELRFDMVGVPVALVVALLIGALCGARWWSRAVAAALVWVAAAAAISPTGYGSPGYAGCLLAVVAGLLLWATRRGERH